MQRQTVSRKQYQFLHTTSKVPEKGFQGPFLSPGPFNYSKTHFILVLELKIDFLAKAYNYGMPKT